MERKSKATNMSSEFFIVSLMYRKGLEPVLTLGRKKEVDIVVIKNDITYTIDVKGLQGKTNWPIGNKIKLESLSKKQNHFFIFVTYLNKFDDLSVNPEVYIVPSSEAVELAMEARGIWGKQDQHSVLYKDLKDSSYRDA